MLDRQQMSKAVQQCLHSYSSSNGSTEAALERAASVSREQSFTELEATDLVRELHRRITSLKDSAPDNWAGEIPAAGQFVLATDRGPPLSPQALKRALVSSDMNTSGKHFQGSSGQKTAQPLRASSVIKEVGGAAAGTSGSKGMQ